MRVIVIEGTPAELQALPQLRQFFEAQLNVIAAEPQSSPPEARLGRSGDPPLLTSELVRRALMRKRLYPNQKAVIGAIYRSPDWISRAEIAERAGIAETSIPGIMGGLGLRFSTTHGWPRRAIHGRPSRLVIEKEKRNGMDYYRATDVFRQGVEAAHVLTD